MSKSYIEQYSSWLQSVLEQKCLVLYDCKECNVQLEVPLTNGLVECPICKNKNDVWLEGESVPDRHLQMNKEYDIGQDN